ncbi:MAG: GxxExxY protein [Verrucomicrobia bacterium]|nr:GxxExxY protein [Verrucomicrobiota bacterium]
MLPAEVSIVELKSVERVTPAYKKQVYLRQTRLKLGYLMNFGEAIMRDGITRIIHGYLDQDPPCLGASVIEEFIHQAVHRTRLRGVGDLGR